MTVYVTKGFLLNDNWLTDKSKTDLVAVGVGECACLASVVELGINSIM